MGSGTKLPKLLTDCRQTKGQMLNGHHLLPAKWKTFRYKPYIPFSKDESIISSCYWLKKNVTFLTLEFGQYGVPRLVRTPSPSQGDAAVELRSTGWSGAALRCHCAPARCAHARCVYFAAQSLVCQKYEFSVKPSCQPSWTTGPIHSAVDLSIPAELISGYQLSVSSSVQFGG